MKTLRELASDYFEHIRLIQGGRPLGRCSRDKILRFIRWLTDVSVVQRPAELTIETIQRWLKHESSRPNARTGLPLSAASVGTTFFKVLPFCAWLGQRGYVPHSIPAAFPKIRRFPVRVKPALLHQDMRHLLECVPAATLAGFRTRALLEFLYTSGVRIAEALAMDLRDIDLENSLVRIHGKGCRDRMVPMGVLAGKHLQTYLRSIRPKLLRAPDQQAVWIGRFGRRLGYFVFYKQLRGMTARMGLPIKVTAHTFRRSCVTELHRSGAPAWAIKELLGHRTFNMLKYYLDVRMEDLRRTHARFHPRDLTPTE